MRVMRFYCIIFALQLREQGYHNLDAIEACQEMLDEAQKKGVYQRYICQLIGPNSLDIEDSEYISTYTSHILSHGSNPKRNTYVAIQDTPPIRIWNSNSQNLVRT